MVILCGEEFKSIKEASIWYSISISVLKSRIKAHGPNWIHLFDKPRHYKHSQNFYHKQHKSQITLLGQTYKSIADAARIHNIRPNTLANRIQRHGNNWPYLFGKLYSSNSKTYKQNKLNKSKNSNKLNKCYLKQSTLLHNNEWPLRNVNKLNKLNKRILYYNITNNLYLKQSALLHSNEWPLRNVNRRLEQYQALQKAYNIRKQMCKDATNAIHQQNCVTLNDITKECNVLIDDLQQEIYRAVNNNIVPISGFYKKDIVLFKKHNQYPGRISPKYVLKREAIQHIKNYQAKIAQTVIIPFTSNRYFYSKIENCVYSKIVTKDKIHFRKINPRKHSDVPNMSPRYLLYLKPYVAVDINLNTVKDIIEYPTITVDDLISTKELQKAYGHNFKSFIILPKLHIRFDSQGHTKRGYIKSQIKFKKKRSDK